jgi:hypothetical protein
MNCFTVASKPRKESEGGCSRSESAGDAGIRGLKQRRERLRHPGLQIAPGGAMRRGLGRLLLASSVGVPGGQHPAGLRVHGLRGRADAALLVAVEKLLHLALQVEVVQLGRQVELLNLALDLLHLALDGAPPSRQRRPYLGRDPVGRHCREPPQTLNPRPLASLLSTRTTINSAQLLSLALSP